MKRTETPSFAEVYDAVYPAIVADITEQLVAEIEPADDDEVAALWIDDRAEKLAEVQTERQAENILESIAEAQDDEEDDACMRD